MKAKFGILRKIGLALVLMAALMLALVLAPATGVGADPGAVTYVRVQFTEVASTDFNLTNTTTEYTIHFTPTTALKRNIDTITVWFPDGSSAMGPDNFDLTSAVTTVTEYLVDRDGEGTTYSAKRITSAATLSTTGYRVTVTTPVDLDAGTAASLRINKAAGIKTADSASHSQYKVKVYTSKDTTPVLSEGFDIDATAPTTVLAVSPATAGSAGQYTFTLTLGAVVTVGGTVTITFPLGTTIPSSITADTVKVSTDAGVVYEFPSSDPVVNQRARSVTVTTPVQLDDNGENVVRFLTTANILNPTVAKNYTDIYVQTSVDELLKKETGGFTFTAGSASKILIANGEIGIGANVYSDNATMIDMYSSQIYVTAGDSNGNAKAATVTVNLSSSPATGAFYTNAETGGTAAFTLATSLSVTADDPRTTAQTAYFKATAAGTYTITASATNYTSATWTFTVAPAVSVYDSNDNLIKTFAPAAGATTIAETGDADPNTQKYASDYINEAITASVAGDKVKLGDGIYEVDNDSYINISKAITLTSVNGASSTTIRNTATIDKAIDVTTDGSSSTPIIIDGLTFQRLRSGTDIHIAVRNLGNNYVTVRNNTFNNIEPSASTTNGQAVVFFNNDDTITSATVSNNTFNNSVTTWPDFSGAKSASISFNTSWHSANNDFTGVTISGNTLTDSGQYGIDIGGNGGGSAGPHTATISNNTITRGVSPIDTADYFTSLTITGNTITGSYTYGIKVEGGNNTLVKIKKNTITDAATYGIQVEEDTAGIITIQYNDITGSNSYAIRNTSSTATQDAKYNYYGSTSGPGTGVTGSLTTSPWLYVSKATVVTDNASYQAVKMSLVAGWNTLSTPVKLISTADAIDELITSGLTIGYYYGSSGWTQITSGYVLSPGDAVYLKMSAATDVLLKFDASAFTNPSKSLIAGWNLIGLASLSSSGMDADDAVSSVKVTATNLPGYSQVLSPSVNAVQTDIYANSGASWSVSSSQAGTDTDNMLPGLGYWIYMQNAATLAGSEVTPLVPNLN